MPVCSLGRAGGGGVMMALPERPNLAVTPTLTESEQRAHFQCPHERGCTSDPDRAVVLGERMIWSEAADEEPTSRRELCVMIGP